VQEYVEVEADEELLLELEIDVDEAVEEVDETVEDVDEAELVLLDLEAFELELVED